MRTKIKIDLQLIDSELDEVWSFVQKKTNKQCIWIAQCRNTRQVIAFCIGRLGRVGAKILWDKLPIEIKKKRFSLFR